MITEFDFGKFFDVVFGNGSYQAGKNAMIQDHSYTLLIAENRRHECPKVAVKNF
jgi:hypothetical protein